MKTRALLAGLLFLLPTYGCIRIYRPGEKNGTEELSGTPEETKTEVAEAEEKKPSTELPPLPSDCPSDLSVQPGPRQVDTRKRPSVLLKNYPQSGWAKGHREPPPDDFYLSDEDAVEAVLKLERQQPSMIPAGYRDKLKEAPKDAALRLHMARCEFESDDTRRRASYDAAIAWLLGAERDAVYPMLLNATQKQYKEPLVMTCGDGSCPKGQTCDPQHKVCMTPLDKKLRYISQSELAVEDALTRGLLRPDTPIDIDGYNNDPRFWWAVSRVHRCGPASICEFSKYQVNGSVELVRWDLRDGGGHGGGYDHNDWVRDNCAGLSGALLKHCKSLSPLK